MDAFLLLTSAMVSLLYEVGRAKHYSAVSYSRVTSLAQNSTKPNF